MDKLEVAVAKEFCYGKDEPQPVSETDTEE
jgi:hypothetical protein